MKNTLLILFLSCFVFAQESLNNSFTLKGGVSIPSGDFGEDTKGGAVTGFGAGFSFAIPLSSSVSFEWDFLGTINSMDVDKVEAYSGTNVDASSWINLYGLIGPRIDANFSNTSSIFMSAKAGGIYANSPELDITGSGGVATMESASAFGFAFAVGGGLAFQNFEIGIYYIGGGEPEFEADISATSQGYSASGEQEFEQEINSIFVYLGFRL